MSYDFPYIMTDEEIKIVCTIRNKDKIIIARKLRGKWKEEEVTYIARTRFSIHVRLLDESTRTLKWNDHGDKWKIIRK